MEIIYSDIEIWIRINKKLKNEDFITSSGITQV